MGLLLNPSLPAVIIAGGVVIALLRWRLRSPEFYTLVCSSAVALGLGEAVCRLTGMGEPRVVRYRESRADSTRVPWAYEPGTTLTWYYPTNPRGYFDERNAVVGHVNSRGFRGEEVERAKRPGSLRLAFLGDSFTLGIGVKDEHTLPARVEEELRRQEPETEVLNFGVSGFDMTSAVALLKSYVLDFEPDVVIAVLFLNDAGSLATMDYLGRGRYFQHIRRYSQLIDAAVSTVETRALTRDMVRQFNLSFADTSPGFRSIREALQEARSLASARQFRFVLAVYPVLFRLDETYPFKSIHQKLEAFCRAGGIEFLDLLPAFLGRRERDMWVHRADQHPNEVAHRLAAMHLADYLNKLALYPSLK